MTFAVVALGVMLAAVVVVDVLTYRRMRRAELERDTAAALVEAERAKAVEDAEKARPFVDLEREVWERYQVRVSAARDDYNTELSRIQAYRDAGIRERARARFLEKQNELLKVRSGI